MKPSKDELDKINRLALEPMSDDSVFVFPVKLCTSEADRDDDILSKEFMVGLVNYINNSDKGLVGIKDHDWSTSNQSFRVFEAWLDDSSDNVCVQGKAYCLSSNYQLIDGINSGILSEVSISFKSSNDKCSICGSDYGTCGHEKGKAYNDETCYRLVGNCDDVYEVSFVAVPCQKAGVNRKSFKEGAVKMKKKAFWLRKNKSVLPEETCKELESVMADESEITEEDVNSLIEENETLKQENEALRNQLAGKTKELEESTVEAEVKAAVNELKPINDKVGECMVNEIDKKSLTLKDGKVEGLDVQIEAVKKSFAGLYGDVSVPATKTVETPPVVEKSTKPNIKFGFGDNVTVKNVEKPKSVKYGLN